MLTRSKKKQSELEKQAALSLLSLYKECIRLEKLKQNQEKLFQLGVHRN